MVTMENGNAVEKSVADLEREIEFWKAEYRRLSDELRLLRESDKFYDSSVFVDGVSEISKKILMDKGYHKLLKIEEKDKEV